MRQKSIKLGVLVLLAALLASLVIPAGAALPEKESSLTITFQYQSTVLPNGVFRAYRVAAASDTGKYPLTEKFLAYYPADTGRTDISGIEDTVGWNALAVGLENYVNNTKPAPDASGKTDSNGQLKFEGVKTTGLYLVMGDPLTIGRTVYTPQTFLVMIPGLKKSGNQYEYLYDVTSTVKVTAETRGGSGGGGTKPTPVNPTPVDPTPVDPTPVDPTPVDPTPDDPTPVDPVPDDGRYFEMEITHTVIYIGPKHRPETDFTLHFLPLDNAPPIIKKSEVYSETVGPSGTVRRTVDASSDAPQEMMTVATLSEKYPRETTTGTITFTAPGLYRYYLYEDIGNKSGVTYDKRGYDVYVQVTETEDGGLTGSWWGQVRGGGDEKYYTLEHVNTWQETKKSPANNTLTKSKLPQTGTELWMVPRMMAGGCGLVAAGIAVRGRKRNG